MILYCRFASAQFRIRLTTHSRLSKQLQILNLVPGLGIWHLPCMAQAMLINWSQVLEPIDVHCHKRIYVQVPAKQVRHKANKYQYICMQHWGFPQK